MMSPDYEMFSQRGNLRVHAIVTRALKQPKPWGYAYQKLCELAQDPRYGEATDTAVRECVHGRLKTEEDFWA